MASLSPQTMSMRQAIAFMKANPENYRRFRDEIERPTIATKREWGEELDQFLRSNGEWM